MYGLAEKQFKNYFFRAAKMKGVTGENLLMLLERRLDNIIYRLGLACNRSEARQLILHRHFLVNGKRVNIPSYLVNQGDELEVREPSRKVGKISDAISGVDRRGVPGWLELDKEGFKGKVTTLPSREDIVMPVREQLIVELYSK
jgi:small subunit ribosomal protein S4